MALEPRTDSATYRASNWPSHQLTPVSDGTINLRNDTSTPIQVSRNDHLCQIRGTHSVDVSDLTSIPKPKKTLVKPSPPYSKQVIIDPNNQLSSEWKVAFSELNASYEVVFENTIGRYNDKSGKVRARINFGTAKPPTRKLRIPNYGKNNLDILQDKFDELENNGVFRRPEELGIVVEHASPSFLIQSG